MAGSGRRGELEGFNEFQFERKQVEAIGIRLEATHKRKDINQVDTVSDQF